ncbi:MarR family winged helix-turn-helix transcriptional regulator [Helicobacter typhlonius]|uniref:MarR family winged helix-turn-helix transcriptional regulator n=1 Tax=Helicobacter typhlonius TaxID=76936 RepID=UPI002FE1067E
MDTQDSQANINCDIYQNIGFLATKLRFWLSSEFDRRIAPLGIIHPQAGILWQSHQQASSQTNLRGSALSNKNYVRMYVDDLESKGLATRKQNPKNRRENLIVLTPSGRQCAEQTYQMMKEVHNDLLLEHISEDEMKELHRILHKAVIGLENKERQKGKQ